MSRALAVSASHRIEAERAAKHLGTASVSLDALSFPHSGGLNPENVDRLKRLYHGEKGWRPHEVANRIPACIERGEFDKYLRVSGILAEDIADPLQENYLKLDFPRGFRLECFRGRHRVEAARRLRSNTEKRWVVDFYPADISLDLKTALMDEYTNEKKPDDGEFYYKIRLFQGAFGPKNAYFEMRWWARLASISGSNNRKQRLQQLLSHAQFGPAFDGFQQIPALYGGMRLSMINKMICLKCHDLLLSFLSRMKEFYYFVFDNDERKMQKVTRADIAALQLTAPGAFPSEARALCGRVKGGEIFEAFSAEERDAIWSRICMKTTDSLVPSLFQFFENLKYLKGPADCMKMMINPKRRDTILSALEDAFTGFGERIEKCPVQIGPHKFKYARVNPVDRFDILYRQLWLFAFREGMDMEKEAKKRLAGPRVVKADERVLFEFAALANMFGFRAEQIEALMQQDPDKSMARRLLENARSPERYKYKNVDDCVGRIVDIIREAEPGEEHEGIFEGEEEKLTRCGLPAVSDHAENRCLLFLANLHGPMRAGDQLKFDFIQRSNYFYFFGDRIACNLQVLEAWEDAGEVECMTVATSCPATPSQSIRSVHRVPVEQEQSVVFSPIRADSYQEEIDVATNRLRDLEERIDLLSSEEREKETELGNLESQLEQKRNMYQSREVERESLERQMRHLQSEGSQLQKRIDELNDEEARKRDNIQRLGQLESNMAHRIETSRIQCEQLAKNEAQLRSAIAKLKSAEKKQVQKSLLPSAAAKTEKQQRETNESLGGTDEAKQPDLGTGEVRVTFMVKEWIVAHQLLVEQSEPSEFQRVIQKYLRKGMGTFDYQRRHLSPSNCLELVMQTPPPFKIYLVPQWEVDKMGDPYPEAGSEDAGNSSTAMVKYAARNNAEENEASLKKRPKSIARPSSSTSHSIEL